MSVLALDLSSTCTGWSLYTKDGKLLDKGRIVPDKKIDSLSKIHYVVNKIKELYNKADELVIEDIYLGSFGNVDMLKYLARLSGAVVYTWIDYKYKMPKFYMAVVARKLVGQKGNAHKAEIQVFILNKYNFATKEMIDKYDDMIAEIKSQHEAKAIKKGAYKYQMDKISSLIDEETEIGEDVADSMVLGLAYCEDNKHEKKDN